MVAQTETGTHLLLQLLANTVQVITLAGSSALLCAEALHFRFLRSQLCLQICNLPLQHSLSIREVHPLALESTLQGLSLIHISEPTRPY